MGSDSKRRRKKSKENGHQEETTELHTQPWRKKEKKVVRTEKCKSPEATSRQTDNLNKEKQGEISQDKVSQSFIIKNKPPRVIYLGAW